MEEKKRFKHKKLLISIGVIVGIVLIYTLAWFINYMKYVKWEKNLGYNDRWNDYVLQEDGYMYSVGKPDFPEFTGNFAIAKDVENDVKPGDVGFDIIIWPVFGGKFEIGVMIQVIEEVDNSGQIKLKSYEMMLDEDFELVIDVDRELTEDEQAAFDAYEENFDELKKLLDRADEIWEIYE